MRISDWSSDVCSSDLRTAGSRIRTARGIGPARASIPRMGPAGRRRRLAAPGPGLPATDRTLARTTAALHRQDAGKLAACGRAARDAARRHGDRNARSEEHTSELQSLMRISYAVFCLKKKTKKNQTVRT